MKKPKVGQVMDNKTQNVSIAAGSELTQQEGEALIGKTIKSINALESSFEITFTDDSTLELSDSFYDRQLGVLYTSFMESDLISSQSDLGRLIKKSNVPLKRVKL